MKKVKEEIQSFLTEAKNNAHKMAILGSTWSPATTETKVRDFLGMVIFLVVAVRVIKQYNDGKKGSAFLEGVVGGIVAMFVKYPEVLTGFMNWGKSMFGL